MLVSASAEIRNSEVAILGQHHCLKSNVSRSREFSKAVYFTQVEKTLTINKYEQYEFKNIIQAKSNTVAS